MALNSNALTTLNTAKTYLKIPLAETSKDVLVELWINAASQAIESECDRKLKAQAITEHHHGRKGNFALLREFPINSVTEVRIDQRAEFVDASTLVAANEYQIADNANCIVFINRTVPLGYNNLKITYNAGYSTVPSDLELACLSLVFWYDRLRTADDIGKTTKSKGDESFSMSQEMPKDVRDTINRYKRVEIPGISAPVKNT
jgi:hypothetical protein